MLCLFGRIPIMSLAGRAVRNNSWEPVGQAFQSQAVPSMKSTSQPVYAAAWMKWIASAVGRFSPVRTATVSCGKRGLSMRCHVGHAYSAEIMIIALDQNLKRAFGSALRALDERIAFARKLQAQAIASGRTREAESWAAKALEFKAEANIIRA